MKTYRVEIKRTAENDLIRRYQQIAEESPQNALNWYLQIIEAIEKLDILAERCPIAPEDAGILHIQYVRIKYCVPKIPRVSDSSPGANPTLQTRYIRILH